MRHHLLRVDVGQGIVDVAPAVACLRGEDEEVEKGTLVLNGMVGSGASTSTTHTRWYSDIHAGSSESSNWSLEVRL